MTEIKREKVKPSSRWVVNEFDPMVMLDELFPGVVDEKLVEMRHSGVVPQLVRRSDLTIGHRYDIVESLEGKPVRVSLDVTTSRVKRGVVQPKRIKRFEVWIETGNDHQHGVTWHTTTPEFISFSEVNPEAGVSEADHAKLLVDVRRILPRVLSPIKFAHLDKFHQDNLQEVARRILPEVGVKGLETHEEMLKRAVASAVAQEVNRVKVARDKDDFIKHLSIHIEHTKGSRRVSEKVVRVVPRYGPISRVIHRINDSAERAKIRKVEVTPLRAGFETIAEKIVGKIKQRGLKAVLKKPTK